MKILRELKKILKKDKKWKAYKIKYQSKQMRFIFSKILIIFDNSISLDKLVKIEQEYYDADPKQNQHMFDNLAKLIPSVITYKSNWLELSKYIFYIYHTSMYYFNTKNNIDNVFTKNNYIKVNSDKRKHYTNWINSLDVSDKTLNTKIRQFLRVVL